MNDKVQETVEILKAQYDQLLKDSDMLLALQGAGVDNWEGFDDAMEMLDDITTDIDVVEKSNISVVVCHTIGCPQCGRILRTETEGKMPEYGCGCKEYRDKYPDGVIWDDRLGYIPRK